jgi:hypothetical protein
MVELSEQQMRVLERLFVAGFRPIAIPPYENALCVHRGEYAAVLAGSRNRHGGGKLKCSPEEGRWRRFRLEENRSARNSGAFRATGALSVRAGRDSAESSVLNFDGQAPKKRTRGFA